MQRSCYKFIYSILLKAHSSAYCEPLYDYFTSFMSLNRLSSYLYLNHKPVVCTLSSLGNNASEIVFNCGPFLINLVIQSLTWIKFPPPQQIQIPFTITQIRVTRKYPLRGYILGKLTHTTALDGLLGGDGNLNTYLFIASARVF